MKYQLEQAWNLYFSRKSPVSITNFVTGRCNARCSHCFLEPEVQAVAPELTVDEYRNLCEKLPKSVLSVNISGGEPFIRDDISSILTSYAELTDCSYINIPTNGSCTARVLEAAEKFLSGKHKKKLTISVSIDNTEEDHDRNRGFPGLFRRAQETVSKLSESADERIETAVIVTVGNSNYNSLDRILEAFPDTGRVRISAVLARVQGRIREIKEYPAIAESYRTFTSRLLERNHRPGKPAVPDRVRQMKDAAVYELVYRSATGTDTVNNCRAGTLYLHISPDGTVFPCELLDISLGRLRDNGYDLNKTLMSGRSEKLRESHPCIGRACSFECAKSVNVLSDRSAAVGLLFSALSPGRRGR